MSEITVPVEGPVKPPTMHHPTTNRERIQSIDTLRGFALLGILVMNIQSFGMLGAAYMNPNVTGPLTGLDYWAWWLSHLFAEMKFMSIFSALFGAGIVLMWQRAKAADRKSTGLHYRRMFWLLLMGLAHAHLLWFGDILYSYAMCGMILYWLCGLRPRWLIPIGMIMLSVGSGLMLMTGFSMPYWGEEAISEFAVGWQPPQEKIDEELATFRGGWLGQMPFRSKGAFMMETFLFGFLFFWRIGGLMLLGMALFKLKFFNASWTARSYVTGAVIGFVLGLTLTQIGVLRNEASGWSLKYSFFLGSQFNYWGSVMVAFGWSNLIMLICQRGGLAWLRGSLAAVGQMALTNYLAHTIICTTLFYGHGFGWFGYLSRSQLLIVVLAIWILQLILSPIWLKHFRFGPFEWLWRSLTYWKIQPLKRATKSVAIA